MKHNRNTSVAAAVTRPTAITLLIGFSIASAVELDPGREIAQAREFANKGQLVCFSMTPPDPGVLQMFEQRLGIAKIVVLEPVLMPTENDPFGNRKRQLLKSAKNDRAQRWSILRDASEFVI